MKKVEVFGDVKDGLYLLQPRVSYPESLSSKGVVNFPRGSHSSLFNCSSPSVSANGTSDVNLWHVRLGHLPFSVMRKFDLIHFPSNFECVCDIYPRARQTRNPFPISKIKSKRLFELIHIDTWGPYKHPTHDGYKYFLTVVDDYSRGTWTFLLTTKCNAFPVLKSFLTMVERQFNLKVKCIRSDNAFELGRGTQEATFLNEQGIIHQRSYTGSPQQNGVVE